MASAALGISALEFIAVDVLQSFNPTSPKRAILWSNPAPPASTPSLSLFGAAAQPSQSALYPQVVVEERHYDELRSTDHPVEQGAAITDHAYKLPPRVQIRGGWAFGSNSSPTTTSLIGSIFNSVLSIIPKATDASQLRTLYTTLVGIQEKRTLVSLVTGKRTYKNLLLEELEVQTDQRTENVLSFTAIFKTLLFATTTTAPVPSANVMTNPAANASTTSLGQTSLLPGSNINSGAANSSLSTTAGPGPLQ